MIDAGRLGEKTGQGFYTHPDPAYLRDEFLKPSPQIDDPT
jgi:3-hydroxybutyryl-CoA dehydrogenase